jgi:hypothetical protein
VKRRERELIMRQGAVLADDPRDRAQGDAIARDLDGSPLRGRPVRQRLRNFRPSAESYLASLGGPLPYMQRLRAIADETQAHDDALRQAWHELAEECATDPSAFERRWRERAHSWRFDAVNELIEKHNRYFPAESRLPMDPRTGDFVLVGGKPYRMDPLGPGWVLERFPPRLLDAAA